MLCPVCPNSQLVITARQSIEIEYCPECRGVWLDRGELDKIIEGSNQEGYQYVAQPVSPAPQLAPQQSAPPSFLQPGPSYGETSFGQSAGYQNEKNPFIEDSQSENGFLRRLFN